VVTVISRFRVRNGLEEAVRSAFLNRPRLVEKAPGFRGLDVLTDADDPAMFLLLTRWTDVESFRVWHRSEAHHQSHQLIPKGLKLDAAFTSLTIGNSIEVSGDIQSLGDALESSPVARWLMESDMVLALLLAPDGAILERNRAGDRIFPPDPARNFGSSIWDYMGCSDVEDLRGRLLDSAHQSDGSLLLNLTDGQQNRITLDVRLLRCDAGTLLLGTPESRNDSQIQSEIFKLTNDLSVTMREGARKNRELSEANKTIQRLARIDALTGLANRRTLDEAFLREIARTERMGESLSLIMADLDQFKSINDEYGHLTGDQVLVQVASVFGNKTRPYDVAARYGGEEFVLLLPGTSTESAIAIAERIRREATELKVPGYSRHVTVSLGVATWRTGETPDEFVGRADAALYCAKSAGRNRVEAASDVLGAESQKGLLRQ